MEDPIVNPFWSYVLTAPDGEDDLTNVYAHIRLEDETGDDVDIIHEDPAAVMSAITLLYEMAVELHIAQTEGIDRVIEVKGEGGFVGPDFTIEDMLEGKEVGGFNTAGNAVAPPWAQEDDDEEA